ncbi:MAG: hypothetical protein LBU70_01975 [Chitinispirillales bacterium]|jgi:hypothetical protein|nr:hypothetical protein [Chitinispirillales bacterium]
MNKTMFLFLAVFFLLTVDCNEKNFDENSPVSSVVPADATQEGNDSVFTQPFYVFSANSVSKYECGYFLFEDTGCPGHLHGFFVWAENLPKEYQKHLLPVTVTFYYTGEECDGYRVVNVINVQKQQRDI